jgi:DNA-binding SARP family transcriptional activator/pimeloyl-ACP methyl ester carboxylesterase
VAVTVGLLGDFVVRTDEQSAPVAVWRRRDAMSLVKVLALTSGHRLHRERLIDLLWPDLSLDEAGPRLHKAAHFARRAVGRADTVVLRGEMVSLFPGTAVSVDVEEFDKAARAALTYGGPAAAGRVLDTFPGEPLPADVYEPWARAVRERMHTCLGQLLRQAQRWEQLLELEPADEEAHVALMRGYVAAGDRAAALRQFERMDQALRRELGVGPSPAVTRLREELLSTVRELAPLTPAEETRLQQQIRFCRTADDVTIAYALTGEGPPLVKAANWLTHLDHDWHSPVWRHWLVDLSRRHTLIRYDERGCGLSDWDRADASFVTWGHDLEAVVDAAGLETFDLLGISQGGAVAVEYAARHPERVRRLVLYGTYAQGAVVRATDAEALRVHQLQVDLARLGWGHDNPSFRQVFTSQFMPGGSKELWDAFNELQRRTTSPENAARTLEVTGHIDVVAAARRVRAPTLVLHARHDQRPPFDQGRLMASLISDSRFVALESDNHILLADEPAWPQFLAEVEAFLD